MVTVFLLGKGARLDGNLKAHLDDFIQMSELYSDLIRSRIARIDPKLCTVELRPTLPQKLFAELARDDFKHREKRLKPSSYAGYKRGPDELDNDFSR